MPEKTGFPLTYLPVALGSGNLPITTLQAVLTVYLGYVIYKERGEEDPKN